MDLAVQQPLHGVADQTKRAQVCLGEPSSENMTVPPLPILAFMLYNGVPPAWFFWTFIPVCMLPKILNVAVGITILAKKLSLVCLLWKEGDTLSGALLRVDENYKRFPPPSIEDMKRENPDPAKQITTSWTFKIARIFIVVLFWAMHVFKTYVCQS